MVRGIQHCAHGRDFLADRSLHALLQRLVGRAAPLAATRHAHIDDVFLDVEQFDRTAVRRDSGIDLVDPYSEGLLPRAARGERRQEVGPKELARKAAQNQYSRALSFLAENHLDRLQKHLKESIKSGGSYTYKKLDVDWLT